MLPAQVPPGGAVGLAPSVGWRGGVQVWRLVGVYSGYVWSAASTARDCGEIVISRGTAVAGVGAFAICMLPAQVPPGGAVGLAQSVGWRGGVQVWRCGCWSGVYSGYIWTARDCGEIVISRGAAVAGVGA